MNHSRTVPTHAFHERDGSGGSRFSGRASRHARTAPSEMSLDGSAPAASTSRASDEEAQLNARRLHVLDRWHAILDAPPTAPGDDVWEAEALREVYEEAARDEPLAAMMREEEVALLDAPVPLSEAEVAGARAMFQSRFKSEPLAPGVLTVGEVVAELEREAEPGAARWPWLESLRGKGEALPSHITASEMRRFWSRLGLSPPREAATAFSQAARLLLMGRANPGALSLARDAQPSGISEAVARLAESGEEAPEDEDEAVDEKGSTSGGQG